MDGYARRYSLCVTQGWQKDCKCLLRRGRHAGEDVILRRAGGFKSDYEQKRCSPMDPGGAAVHGAGDAAHSLRVAN